MTPKEKSLLWCCVEQAKVLRKVEAAFHLIHPIGGDICMHEARYQRAIKDAGLEKEAKEIEEELE
jgi:hypothetical protein